MKFAVIVFPGSNCDNDAYYVIRNQLGVDVDFVWHKDSDLSNYDGIIIPGGFSYGDYLRAGAVARFSKIMNAIKLESTKGKAIIGICNGFQILVESGLLPGALITNKSTRFISKEIQLEVSNNESLFFNFSRIFITGNLVVSIFFRSKLFKIFMLIFLDLIFLSLFR